MRNTFIEKLVELAEKNPAICLMVGDLGYGAVEPFFDRFGHRAINAGIAEQNMAGMAAGLAMGGKHVFTYSIGNFPTFRCAEQIRNDIDYHNLPVTTVAVGGGLSYGALGYSHHTVQDFGLMRLFPNTIIMSPCDPNEVDGCLDFIQSAPQPSYLRLGKAGEKNFTTKVMLKPGNVNKLTHNNSATLVLTTGTAIQNVSAQILSDFDVYSVPMWGQKVRINKIEDFIKEYEEIIILEDHLKSCGFFSWIIENVEDRALCSKISSMSFSDDLIGQVGSHQYLQSKFLRKDLIKHDLV
jgi:transketolase